MISVCLPLYNGERFVSEQIQSILSQLASGDELIISDDASTDKSIEVLRRIQDSRIRLLIHSQRLGAVGNMQRALMASKGGYVFLSDQDDLWMPGKVSSCLTSLKTFDLVLHDAVILDEAGRPILPSLFAMRSARRGFWANWFRNSYTGCCMAFRREVLLASLPFPAHIPMHDQWIGLVAERKFKVSFLPEALIGYRQHGNNATNTVHGSNNSIWTRLHWRLTLLRSILFHSTQSNSSLHESVR